ncbi:luc7-like protein 3 [Lucilia cuprina]|uniref:luc7-like protein 3 n=1 Tax=Lucilia cuprina TaxID=7375 RepID=UPI001F05DB8E|nr:luc7-like protein 3 [Lucilia cuprina]
MVDAARQMLDELMGRNRNLHPSEAPKSVNWEDPDLCQYHLVKFCPHELFVNTRADLGPCGRIHDDEAKQKYAEARPTSRKRQYEDEFLYFCNSMLNDVDRKIQKGRQRLALMQRDQPAQSHVSKYREQLNNLNARIKKLVAEAEEAGTRGDVDQAQDLMVLCEQLKEERDTMVTQYENNMSNNKDEKPSSIETTTKPVSIVEGSPSSQNNTEEGGKSPRSDDDTASSLAGDKKLNAWMQDMGHMPEKQMEVCEVCGAFLIVGDAQQRIEDHLMGKQHLGYSKLRKAVEEIHEQRQKEREVDDRSRRRDDRSSSHRSFDMERRRDREREYRGRSREHGSSHHHAGERHRHHHKSHHRRRSHSRSRSHRSSRDRYSRSRSRSRY